MSHQDQFFNLTALTKTLRGPSGPFFISMSKKIIMWGESIIPLLVSSYEDKLIETDDPRSNEFVQYFDQLVKKYPFIKEGHWESVYIWLVITKMGNIEGWDTFTGNPKIFVDEVEKRIKRLFPNLLNN